MAWYLVNHRDNFIHLPQVQFLSLNIDLPSEVLTVLAETCNALIPYMFIFQKFICLRSLYNV